MNCIYCENQISSWQHFIGFFWKLPLRLNEFSQVWEECCSHKCYGRQLEKMLKSLQVESAEVLDLSDFLFRTACKFITVEQVMKDIDKIQTTDWAKHIIAAGYRKVAQNNNPYKKWHRRD
ncbi:hypothetical protein LCGC14_0543500 [marine sediment metagenome]|uniref:Uncharacterized protein n=1 Tax=marine sediment metagenome TaxID=412755 RepID=A0A0F9UDC5_9ZZZZ